MAFYHMCTHCPIDFAKLQLILLLLMIVNNKDVYVSEDDDNIVGRYISIADKPRQIAICSNKSICNEFNLTSTNPMFDDSSSSVCKINDNSLKTQTKTNHTQTYTHNN